MNMMQMMQKAQSIQKKLQETQAQLAETEFSGEAGGVVVTCDGQGKFKSIKISKEAINPENPESVEDDTIEMLEDVITTAVKQATETASKEMETKEFTAKAGGGAVEVTVTGKKEVVSVKISEEAVDPDDVETLEDMVKAAVNEALKQADAANAEMMGRMTGGLGGLPF